jgi:hypothetical protein
MVIHQAIHTQAVVEAQVLLVPMEQVDNLVQVESVQVALVTPITQL